MKPRVLLDIAILGHGFDMRSSRRGVERLVNRLFTGLKDSSSCDASFVATANVAGTYDFLAAQNPPLTSRFSYTETQLLLSRLARSILEKVHATADNRKLGARGIRRLQSLAFRLLTYKQGEFPQRFITDIDIFHQPHLPFPNHPFPDAVRTHRKIKKFVTIHDLMAVTHPEFFAVNAVPYVDQIAECISRDGYVFCVSESVRSDVLSYMRVDPDRVFVASPAADPDFFFRVGEREIRATLKELEIPDTPYFLALSVPEVHKNFAHLIRCFGELMQAKELSDCNLVIIGRGASTSSSVCKALREYPALKNRVIMPGFIPDRKLAAIYSGAIAFLFPSLAEGFGFPPLEAMQCGTPVLSSNTTSLPEVVGDAGMLLPPTDVDAWCQAMLRITHDSQLRTNMSIKSLERAKIFSWDSYLDATIEGYRASLA